MYRRYAIKRTAIIGFIPRGRHTLDPLPVKRLINFGQIYKNIMECKKKNQEKINRLFYAPAGIAAKHQKYDNIYFPSLCFYDMQVPENIISNSIVASLWVRRIGVK